MTEIWNMTRKPEFWFATVLVGLFLNFGTTLYFRWHDRFWPKWSSKRRMAKIEEEKSRDRLAEIARGNGFDILYKQNAGIEFKVDANTEFIGALACLTICQSYGSANWISLIYFVFGLSFLRMGFFRRKMGNRLTDIAKRACYVIPEKDIEDESKQKSGKDLKQVDERHDG